MEARSATSSVLRGIKAKLAARTQEAKTQAQAAAVARSQLEAAKEAMSRQRE
jgi:hypothetical protein